MSDRFTSVSKPAAQKSSDLSQSLQHLRFILFFINETFATFLDPVVNPFTRQTFPTVSRKHFFMNILYIEFVCPQKTHNRTLLFGSMVIILTAETSL
jgi:hypothetical protein